MISINARTPERHYREDLKCVAMLDWSPAFTNFRRTLDIVRQEFGIRIDIITLDARLHGSGSELFHEWPWLSYEA